jgi:predicted DNA-binding protein (MmcQ/YjbR family)
MAKRYDPESVMAQLQAFALDLPDAHLDHPWGDTVVKTNGGKKIFVFLGQPGPDASGGVTVKLVDSHEQAMGIEGATPTGYGLGKAGWVSIPLLPAKTPTDVLEDWIEESYRQVALKRNLKELDARER